MFSVVAALLCITTISAEELEWWRTATLYEVYPRSFKDSDGDGIGDLKGITENAQYFKDIGVDAIWLSPINTSPMVDFGYDISNFTEIEPIFGTMNDFDELLAKLKQIGVRLLIDFVPNHTSDKHMWFQISKDPTHPLHPYYRDFYVWLDANGTTADDQPIPPNNWLSIFGGGAWTWCDARQQFYFHQFAPQQPDLNYRNQVVLGNMTDVMYFWLEKGIDGFRLDAAPHLFEDANFTNEEVIQGSGDVWKDLNHTRTMHLQESMDLSQHWSDVVYEWGLKNGSSKVVVLETYVNPTLAKRYYGTGKESLQIPFNFNLMSMNGFFMTSTDIKGITEAWMSVVPSDGVANWVIGNHDVPRLPERYGNEMANFMCILIGILPGIKVVYYGEEIAMENTLVSWSRTVDTAAIQAGPDHYQERSRDFCRTPMQWDDSLNAGFSTNETTWLPVNSNYWWLNVEAQRAAPVSHLKVFQAISKARKDPVLQRGDLSVHAPDNDTLVVIRHYNGSYFALVTNLGITPATYTSQSMFKNEGLEMDMTVVVGSVNSGYSPGESFKKGYMNITLRPKAAILLKSGYTPATTSGGRQFLYSAYTIIIPSVVIMFYSITCVL